MYLEGVGEDNGHDNAIDGNSFAKDDAVQDQHQDQDRPEKTSHLMRFFVLMRGAMTPPPRMLDPVIKIPLHQNLPSKFGGLEWSGDWKEKDERSRIAASSWCHVDGRQLGQTYGGFTLTMLLQLQKWKSRLQCQAKPTCMEIRWRGTYYT